MDGGRGVIRKSCFNIFVLIVSLLLCSCIQKQDVLLSFDDAEYVVITSDPVPDGFYEGGDPLVDALADTLNALDPQKQAIPIDPVAKESILHHLKIQIQKKAALEMLTILVLDNSGCIVEKIMQDTETETQNSVCYFWTSDDALREAVIAVCEVY